MSADPGEDRKTLVVDSLKRRLQDLRTPNAQKRVSV